MENKKLKSEDEVEDKEVGIFGESLGTDMPADKIIEEVLEQDRKFMEDMSKNTMQADDDFSQGLFGEVKKKKNVQ